MKLASMARGHANLHNQIRSIKTANGDEQNVPRIGIGGSLAAPPLPHHRTYGSVYGGSRSWANTLRTRMGDRAI